MGDLSSVDEFFGVAERIIQNINAVFDRDNSLDEFDIVPVESQSNRSPVIHINHKLALESWCVPFLYSHSFACFTQVLPKKKNSFNNNKQHQNNGNDDSTIPSSTTSSLCRQQKKRKNSMYSLSYIQNLTEREKLDRKLNLSRILLLLNPDLTVAWNFRREIFQKSLPTFHEELSLVSLISSRKPKCSDAFSYRKWLIKNFLKDETPSSCNPESLYQIFENEIQAVEIAAAKYFSNYHAWNYRLWLLQTFLSLSISSSFSTVQIIKEFKCKIIESEKALSETWIHNHVSDYSGFHYRQRLLIELCKIEQEKEYIYGLVQHSSNDNNSLISISKDEDMTRTTIKDISSNNSDMNGGNRLVRVIDICQQELDTNTELITRFPGHETLWYHRRFILQLIIPKILLSKGKISKENGLQNIHKLKESQESQQQYKMEIDDNNDNNKNYTNGMNGWTSIEEINSIKKKEEDLVKNIYLVNAPLLLLQEKSTVHFITKDSSRVNLWYSEKHVKWLLMFFNWHIEK